ncbi:MAG: metalloregulator ArsR/SmtB family transcription factor [Candidatus Bipolaricaulota bacterium]
MPKLRTWSILVITYMDPTNAPKPTIEVLCAGLRVLSVETRLRMLTLLAERNLCVGALACQLGLTQGAVSQHLKVLREAGLVAAERAGYFVHYKVDGVSVGRLQAALDRMLEQVQRGRADRGPGSETAKQGCGSRKESACAKSRQVVARRGAT